MSDDESYHDDEPPEGRTLVAFLRHIAKAVDRLTIHVHALQSVLDKHGIPAAEVEQARHEIARNWKGTMFSDWLPNPGDPGPPSEVQ